MQKTNVKISNISFVSAIVITFVMVATMLILTFNAENKVNIITNSYLPASELTGVSMRLIKEGVSLNELYTVTRNKSYYDELKVVRENFLFCIEELKNYSQRVILTNSEIQKFYSLIEQTNRKFNSREKSNFLIEYRKHFKLIELKLQKFAEDSLTERENKFNLIHKNFRRGIGFIIFNLILVLINWTIVYRNHKKDRELKETLEQELENERVNSFQNAKLTGMGEIASSMAHEINNPLTIINLAVSKIKRSMEGTVEQVHAVENAQSGIVEIAKVIDALKNVTTQKNDAKFVPRSLKEILSRIESFYTGKCLIKGYKFEVTELGEDIMLYGKGNEIEQVLVALISNALEGNQKVEERWIKVIVNRVEDEKVSIRITDGGTFISDDIKSKLFTPFYTTKKDGVGLGLNMCLEIAKRHQGELIFDDNAQNTSFVLTLPIMKVQSGPIAA